jgi:hypothetical protein
VTDTTPDSLSLSWTIPEGQFDHFLVQYKNGDGQPKVVRVPGHEDQVTISGLEADHKYKMNLYGFHSGQRVGPESAIGMTGEWAVGAPGWDPVRRGSSCSLVASEQAMVTDRSLVSTYRPASGCGLYMPCSGVDLCPSGQGGTIRAFAVLLAICVPPS